MRKLVLGLISVLLFTAGCKGKYSEHVLDLDVFEEIELSPLTSDVKIVPIKCSIPMDGIRQAREYDDYTIMLGSRRETIYILKEDSVVAILNSVGRGHGEYSSIDDFAYDEESKVIYVNADRKLLKYDVPSMTFIGSLDINYSICGMIVLNKDEILVNCSYNGYSEDTKPFKGICVISSVTGEFLRRCLDFDYYEGFCSCMEDMIESGDDIFLSTGGLYINRILKMDSKTKKINELESFSFSPKWRVPKKLLKKARKNDMFGFSEEADARTVYCDGCHYPAIINSKITYWCYPYFDIVSKRSNIVNIKVGEKTISRKFFIPGMKQPICPYYYKDNHFVVVIYRSVESLVTDKDELSDFGKEICSKMNAQPFNNPVLLSFTVDKDL
jgi:hypothetical protein